MNKEKRRVYDEVTGKHYIITVETDDIRQGSELQTKLREKMHEVEKALPNMKDLNYRGYMVCFCYDITRNNKFDTAAVAWVEFDEMTAMEATKHWRKVLDDTIEKEFTGSMEKIRTDIKGVNE